MFAWSAVHLLPCPARPGARGALKRPGDEVRLAGGVAPGGEVSTPAGQQAGGDRGVQPEGGQGVAEGLADLGEGAQGVAVHRVGDGIKKTVCASGERSRH